MGCLLDALSHAYDVLGFDQLLAGMRCSAAWWWPEHRAGQQG
jgi:hypothetical protein